MANFNTHLLVASIATSAIAVCAVNFRWIDLLDAPWFIFMGSIGGLLPDIDSDHSKPAKLVFLLLASISSLTMLSGFSSSHSIKDFLTSGDIICHPDSQKVSSLISALTEECVSYPPVIITLATFIIVRYPLFVLFKSLTVHRGVFHSISAAILFALLTTCITHYYLKQDIIFAWQSGLFIGVGFIVHLLLDEICSVDLSNSKIKRSFGTALKLWNYNSWPASLFMLLCTLTLYITAPPLTPFIDRLRKQNESHHYLTNNSDSKTLLLTVINKFESKITPH